MGYLRGLRRGKLATWTALGAALTCAGAMAAPGATRAQATRAQATPIRHVVVIYLENHSFDSLLGYWCDAHRGRCPDGGMPSSVRLSNGAVVTPRTDPDTVPVVNHTVAAQRAAIDGGKMDGWQKIGGCTAATGYRCISGYQPAQVPNITALAQGFAISDRTFSLGDSPSWAGHMDLVAASADGFVGQIPAIQKGVPKGPGWGCDSNRVTPWLAPNGRTRQVPSCVPSNQPGLPFGGAFKRTPVRNIPTIMDRLDEAGLSWKLYGATRNQQGYVWSICPTFAECLDTNQDANLVPDQQFLTAAAAGTLPAFSVVTPGGGFFTSSCHNSVSITACDNWVGQLVGAVERSPDWSSTAVFLTWDDCGCFYDQVAPGTNPDGTSQGPRVPMIIVSPFARPHFTDTTATTFTGILAFTEHNFELSPLGANDASAYPFSNAFDFGHRALKPVRMVQRPLPASARHIHVTKELENDPT